MKKIIRPIDVPDDIIEALADRLQVDSASAADLLTYRGEATRQRGKHQMNHEWDWPPTRRWRYYRTFDAYQPSGWNSPVAKKIVRIYWRATITAIKMLIAIPLSIMAIGAFW